MVLVGAAHQVVEGRVGRGPLLRAAELQDVLGGVLRVEPELVDGPLLHRADPDARRELVLGRLLQVVDGRLDPLAAADVDAAAELQAADDLEEIPAEMLLSVVEEDERLLVDMDPCGGERLAELAEGAGGRQLRLEDPWSPVGLDENNDLRHGFSL